MNNKMKPIVMVGLAMVIAFIITLWIWNRFMKEHPLPPPLITQSIAVATKDLAWGKCITSDDFQMVPFLKESLPAGSFSDSNSANKPGGLNILHPIKLGELILESTFNSAKKLVGRTILYPIKLGEPILESRLAPITTKDGGLAVLIGAGKRAMAVKVDKIVGVAGFIYPRHRVDVLVSLREKDQQKRTGPITKTVLENIQVLAVGTEMAVETTPDKTGKKNEKSVLVDVITLEVSPEEGEKLALAATEGKIQLALRNCSTAETTGTKGITIPDLLASCTDRNPPPPPPPKNHTGGKNGGNSIKHIVHFPPPPPAQPLPFIVELVKGDKISEVKFDKGI